MLAAGRSPWWGSALPGKALAGAALGCLAAIGVAVVDDYGISADEAVQRHLGFAVLYQVLGDRDAERQHRDLGELHTPVRFYGTAFETPLAAVERLLGLTDSRDIHLTRHLLTHLLFLAGGGCAALLAHRLFGSGWLALLAFALFALHPRLYAHSFFNSKDAAFAAAFMACLALTERAFRRGTPGAFALLGLGVGVLVNLRVMGALLAALVLAAKAADGVLAHGWAARRRALATLAAFAGAGGCALYAVTPYMWRDPSHLIEAFAAFARHPVTPTTLFEGAWVHWPHVPAHYIPTWIGITTPPAALALAGVGAAAVLTRVGAAAKNPSALPPPPPPPPPPRFGLLLVACLAAAILGVMLANANVYNGWRHLHFLWAPLAIVAVAGAKWLAGAGRRPALRRVASGLTAAAVASLAVPLAAIHPHQAMYFNALVDRDAPERLGGYYELDYWRLASWEAVRHLVGGWPGATLDDANLRDKVLLLPPEQRRGLLLGQAPAVDFVIDRAHPLPTGGGAARAAPVAHAVTVYDNTVMAMFALDPALLGGAAARALEAELRAVAAGVPVARAGFDLHLAPGALTWLKAPCGDSDVRWEFFLRTAPPHPSPPPQAKQEFTEQNFNFARHGARVDGACLLRTPLPHGPLATIEAGQRLAHSWKPGLAQNPVGDGPDLWRVAIDLSAGQPIATDATRPPLPPAEALVALPADAPFDLHLHGRALVYARQPCRPEDALATIFLHAFPADPALLPRHRRRNGFLNLDFKMAPHDAALIARFGGRCVASRQLPDFPIAYLRTGQYAGGAQLWVAEFTDLL